MKAKRRLQKKYVYTDRIIIIILCFALSMFFNFVHNSKVAGETKSRDFAYNAWQMVTKDSKLFKGVKTRDVFISANQNDAFETNAGSFYWNTGIRLAYIFNVSIVWPQYSNCQLTNTHCTLPDVRKIVIKTFPNLQRGAFVPVGRNIKQSDDWVNVNSKPGALDKSRFWWFDLYLMTPKTMVVLLAPFDESAPTASVNFHDFRLVSITKADRPEFTPAMSNVCLVRDTQTSIKDVKSGGLTMTYWKVPEVGHSPGGKPISVPALTDIRGLGAGSC